MSRTRIVASSLLAVVLTGATLSGALAQGTPEADGADVSVGSLRLIGEQDLANDLMVDDTLVGGLSGLDYDAATDRWIVLSDDRSDLAPARFYDATFSYDDTAFDRVELTDAVTLLQEDGEPFPNVDQGGAVPDPESIRVDPQTGDYYWTTEGSQELGIDPGVYITEPDGTYVGSLPAGDLFAADTEGASGIRNNGAFEGLTFARDGASYYLTNELPLYQDGPTPDAENGGLNRITQYDREGAILAQYGYETDAVPNAAADSLFVINGITEILAVSGTQFLLLERGTVQAADETYSNDIRVYLVDIAGATDVNGVDSLVDADFTPAAKTLIAEFDGSDFTVDNLETLAFGPTLASGNPSLVIGSDNNFSDTQLTQFLVFEVLPSGSAATPGATPEGTPVIEEGTGQDQDLDSATPAATPAA